MDYESVIGLEVHVQIKTESKLFCSCPTLYGASPNTHICPVCTGQPGALPVLNQQAVASLVKTALALNCRVNPESIFARKQYFYPDLPKNYQISQYEKPLSEKGFLMIQTPIKKVGITRIHLEEDAGKLLHTIGPVDLKYSLVDLNRTGIPLMEIVSEPDLSTPDEAEEYLTRLKMTLQYLGVSDCDMEKGSLRCDANISIRPTGNKTLGTKVELKNMNSFRGVRDAVAYEIERQIEAVRQGERIVQETRLWDAAKKETRPMRSKEEAHDYRYFPEPDLLPLRLDSQWIENIRRDLPELPAEKRNRFVRDYTLSEYDAAVLTSDIHLADFYEKTVKQCSLPQFPKLISNWITTELLGRLHEQNKTILDSPIQPAQLAALAQMILDGTISGKIAKTVFDEMWQTRQDPKTIVREKGLTQVLNAKEIEDWATLAIQQNPKAVEEFHSGKEKALQALIGSVMKLSKGKANPALVLQALKKILSKD